MIIMQKLSSTKDLEVKKTIPNKELESALQELEYME